MGKPVTEDFKAMCAAVQDALVSGGATDIQITTLVISTNTSVSVRFGLDGQVLSFHGTPNASAVASLLEALTVVKTAFQQRRDAADGVSARCRAACTKLEKLLV